MLSPSPPEHTAAPTTPQAESTAEEGDGSTAGGVEGGEGEDNALAATTADITAVAGEQELSGIAKAMRELEEAACPKKRTMTRFSFLGGACNCL